MRARHHLVLTGRRKKADPSIDLQPEIARRMGYAEPGRSGDQTPAVENCAPLFLIAREVGA